MYQYGDSTEYTEVGLTVESYAGDTDSTTPQRAACQSVDMVKFFGPISIIVDNRPRN